MKLILQLMDVMLGSALSQLLLVCAPCSQFLKAEINKALLGGTQLGKGFLFFSEICGIFLLAPELWDVEIKGRLYLLSGCQAAEPLCLKIQQEGSSAEPSSELTCSSAHTCLQ